MRRLPQPERYCGPVKPQPEAFRYCRACNGRGTRGGPCVACSSERAAWFRDREEQSLKEFERTGRYVAPGFDAYDGEVLMSVRDAAGSITEVVMSKGILDIEGDVA